MNPNLIPPRLREKLDQISKMQKNPNVTVRSRGVMEKCTYCVQRINEARIGWNTQDGLEPAKRNQVPDGFFETACQQACPSNSIVFGDILDATNEYTTAENTKRVGSKIHATRGDARSYMLIGYLATRPRTTHMMKVRNPNRSLLLRGGTSGEDRVKGWENPFHHGSGGHGEEPAAPAGAGTPGHSMFDRKRTEDGSVSLALRVLGGVHA